MKSIKYMLVGISIFSAAVLFHLFLEDGLITDILGLGLGMLFVIIGIANRSGSDSDKE